MHRIWTVLFLVAGALCPSGSWAFAAAPDRCEESRIRAQLASSGQFPSLKGCDPDSVRNALSDSDYGIVVDGQAPSNRIRPGLITKQRVQGSIVHVVVSTGPDREREEAARGIGEVLGQIIVGVMQPRPPPDPQPPPPPPPIIEIPPPALQPQAPEPQAPAAPPPEPPQAQPVPVPVAQADPIPIAPAPVAEPARGPGPVTPQAPTPAPPRRTATDTPAQPPAPLSPDPPPAPEPAPPAEPDIAPPPPAPAAPIVAAAATFTIEGVRRIEEGDSLELLIRRHGTDRKRHRLILSYSDPSLLRSAPTLINYGSDLPDVLRFKLATNASRRRDGDRELAITLVSAEGARVGNPDSLMTMIVDRPSFPTWAMALAAAAAAAASALGLAKFILPRATCSIGSGRPTLGATAPRRCWPALSADTILGTASFIIPRPLRIGGAPHAKPSPA